MRFPGRTVCVFLVAVSAVLFASPARAATIDIGTFEWLESFLGDGSFDFFFTNDTGLAAPAFQKPFDSVQVTLTFDDATTDSVPFPTELLVGGAPSENYLPAATVVSARLQFHYAPDGYPALDYDETFTGPGLTFLTYTYDDATPVPEPATAVTAVTGIALLLGVWCVGLPRAQRQLR
jgi:hypothetical protein